ncbi:methyl-accepting chemotaxis protein [Caballeronia sp. LP006]|uniref:methyl-accepting chemotaxis protein n=1 Tax=unclassified Caballeronia TaxID=2646786 RepID=UPI001FD0EDBB|nr:MULTISPECIES: methyl-accepting chemotaxis protein [unclassified Caballeronia]MDR5828287.1 methyl-accepting chemotaxis protein [Caballeronia sp. LP006]
MRVHRVKHLSIRHRILASFGVILFLMLVMAALSYTLLGGIDREAKSLEEDSMVGLSLSNDLRAAWLESYAVTQRLVFADSDEALIRRDSDRLTQTRATLDKLIENYAPTVHEEDERRIFDEFRHQRALYAPLQDEALRGLIDSKQAGATVFNTRLTPVWEAGQNAARALVDYNEASNASSVKSIRHSVGKSETTLVVIMLVALATAAVLGFLLMRALTVPMLRLVDVVDKMRTGDFTQRLDLARADEFGTLEAGFNRMTDELTGLVGQAQKSALQVTTSVSEIAATAREQQATASETAATTTEIGATSREIFATARDLVRTMNEVSGVAEQSATLAGTGHAGLTRMEETMRHVMEAAGSVNGKLAILNEKAGNINQVVATITKVADQTNLLSLNAAIEAEKAGEYGRGFAVVATEIRRLADQTAVATFDIEQMVKEIQSSVAAGVMGMDKFSEEVRRGMLDVQQVGGQLSQIIHQVQTLAPRVSMVNEGMQTQAAGADQISQALSQLSEAAQQTAESLRQSTQAIDDLTHVANGLRTGVSRFKVAA